MTKENREFKFDEKTHTYTLNGKRLTGVTTILGVISKPALLPWVAKCTVEHIRNHYDKPENLPKLLEEARKAHLKKRDKAGDIGTLVHKQCEKWINGEDTNKMNTQAFKMYTNFVNWATENKVKFLASEKRVFSELYFFAGTYDFLCEIDGKIFLGDIKTSSNIYPEHFAQCAAYQICEQEMNPKQRIDGHIIVNLKKDGKINIKTSFDYAGYRKMFLGALAIYRQLND